MTVFAGLEADVDSPRRLFLQHPVTGQSLRNAETGEEAWIDVLSSDSEVAHKHNRANINSRIKRKAQKISAEELETEGVELLAKLTRGWALVDLAGKPISVPFSEQNARALYSTPSLAWIKRQVDQFSADVGNWIPGSSTT